MKSRNRNLVIKLDDTELCKLHHLASLGDEPIAMMIRRWLNANFTARCGDATPPPSITKFGQVIDPTKR